MRTQQEMLALILDTAQNDERIRAVIMNGSRTNPNAQPDIFQDYDIVYIVTEAAAFKDGNQWIQRFGELMVLQLPDDMAEPPPSPENGFAYLMQFSDGNRIDLTIFPLARLPELGRDSLSRLLLDKDGLIAPFAPASESDYLPPPPTAKAFFNCCNEFWWVCPYVAKGLWREEIIYAKAMMEILREQLMQMLTWTIGVQTQFLLSPGKLGKKFPHYLTPMQWQMLLQTYADADYENNWEALRVMGELFRQTAVAVAAHFGFDYAYDDDRRVTAHLQHVRTLPKNAPEIY